MRAAHTGPGGFVARNADPGRSRGIARQPHESETRQVPEAGSVVAAPLITGGPHCPECAPGDSCNKGHLYVIELRPPEDPSRHVDRNGRPYKGWLYVGSTGKTVEARFDDHFNGRYRDSRSGRLIQERYRRHRPEFYLELNPVTYDKADKNKRQRAEAKLADRLRNQGWHVEGPSWKREKARRRQGPAEGSRLTGIEA